MMDRDKSVAIEYFCMICVNNLVAFYISTSQTKTTMDLAAINSVRNCIWLKDYLSIGLDRYDKSN